MAACARATRPRRTGQTAAFSARTSARASVNSRRTAAIAILSSVLMAHLPAAGRNVSLELLRWFPREDAAADYECGHDRRENHQWHDLHCHCGALRRLTPPLPAIIRRFAYQVLRNISGNLAMFAAMRLASSLLSKLRR